MELKFTLEEWRKIKNKSQTEMADICGVHLNTYRVWEKCSSKIEIGKFLIIVDSLEVGIDNIILT